MKKGLIALIVLVILIGAGIGAEYYASTQITYDVNKVHIDSVDIAQSQLNMRIWITFTSPSGIPIWVNGGTYELSLDGNYLGSGAFGEILATSQGSQTIFTLNDTGSLLPLTGTLLSYLAGNSITVKVTIESLTVLWVITLAVNLVETQTMNVNSA